jgi:hypothetical protein
MRPALIRLDDTCIHHGTPTAHDVYATLTMVSYGVITGLVVTAYCSVQVKFCGLALALFSIIGMDIWIMKELGCMDSIIRVWERRDRSSSLSVRQLVSGWIRIFLAGNMSLIFRWHQSFQPHACRFFLAPCSSFLENDGHSWLYCYMEIWDRGPKLKCFMF